VPKKYYAMTGSQKMMFLAQDFAKEKQINNISMLVTLDNADPAILTKSAEIAVEKCDAMRLCYDIINREKNDYSGYLQYFSDGKSENIQFLDFSEKTDDDMYKVLRSAVNRNLCKPTARMYRLLVLKTPQRKTAIFLAVSITIMDRWAMNVFLSYVFGIYEAITNNSKMPEPPYSYEKLLEKELNEEADKTAEDKKFWKNLFLKENEPVFTHPDGREILEKYRKKKENPNLRYVEHLAHGGKSETKRYVIPKEHVSAVYEFSKKTNTSVQAVLSCILMLMLGAINKENDVTVRTVVSRRSSKEEKYSLGSRTMYLPLRMIIKPEMTFSESCMECYLCLCSIYRHPNMSHRDLFSAYQQVYNIPYYGTYSSVSITFLPLPLKFMGKNVKTEWLPSGSISHLMHISAVDDDGSGGMRLYIETLVGGAKSNSADKLIENMKKILIIALDNPNLTVEEIGEMMKKSV